MYINKVKIEVLMAERELTQSELVERCGITRAGFRYALRRGGCGTAFAGKIAKGLGVSVSDILAMDEDLHRRNV